MSASPSAPASTGGEKKACCKCKHGKKVKPSELPLYGNPYPPKDIILNSEPGPIEDGFRATREAISPYVSFFHDGLDRSRQFLNTGLAHAKTTYETVSDDGNVVHKTVAITGGGLVGLLLASRKGFFKKILYTSSGIGATVALCYPKQTAELVELSTYIARKKGPELVKEYTGYDISPYVAPVNGPPKQVSGAKTTVSGKLAADQSSPADKDLNANRSVK